jgi:hypothetical protein
VIGSWLRISISESYQVGAFQKLFYLFKLRNRPGESTQMFYRENIDRIGPTGCIRHGQGVQSSLSNHQARSAWFVSDIPDSIVPFGLDDFFILQKKRRPHKSN